MQAEAWTLNCLNPINVLLISPRSAQAAILQLFPPFFLLAIELAGQRFNRNVVLLTEVTPEDKAEIKLPRLI